jgi:hypothetical protein
LSPEILVEHRLCHGRRAPELGGEREHVPHRLDISGLRRRSAKGVGLSMKRVNAVGDDIELADEWVMPRLRARKLEYKLMDRRLTGTRCGSLVADTGPETASAERRDDFPLPAAAKVMHKKLVVAHCDVEGRILIRV